MNYRTFLVAVLVAVPLTMMAQAPDTTWTRQIGAPNSFGFATDIYVDGDGHIYTCGQARPPSSSAAHLVVAKLDEWGDTLWVRYLSGSDPDGSDNLAHALAADDAGNIYVAGALTNEPLDRDMTVAKLSPDGEVLWAWVSGFDDDDIAYAIAVGNNQVYVGGVSSASSPLGSFTVARLDAATGALVWKRDSMLDPWVSRVNRPGPRQGIARYPDFYDEWSNWDNCASAIAICPVSGQVVATGWGYHGTRDYRMWTMRFDTSGTLQWTRNHGRTNFAYDDVAFDLAIAQSGDIYICGMGEDDAPGMDWLVIRMGSNGTELNRATLNAAYNGDDWATAITLDSATPENIYVTGFLDYGPTAGSERIVTMKYGEALAPRWGAAGAQYRSDVGSHPDIGYDVHYRQGHIYVTGQSGQDGRELVLLCYTDANATPKSEKWATTLELAPAPGTAHGSRVYAQDTTRIFVAGDRAYRSGRSTELLQMVALRFSWHYRDVTPDSLLAPVGRINYGTYIVPRVRVSNLGDAPATFEVRLQIGDAPGYHDTTLVTGLMPGQTGFAVFDTWYASPAGMHDILVTTAMVGDSNPANDTIRGSVNITGYRDAGVTEILAPLVSVDSGLPVTPIAAVHNYSDHEVFFPVYFTIGPDYSDTVRVRIAAGEGDTVQFKDWLPLELGWHDIFCWTGLTRDVNPANDTQFTAVQVIPGIVGVVEPDRLPTVFALEAVSPMPFRHGTAVRFALPRPAEVALTIYDATGRPVRTLTQGRLAAGRHSAAWDGRDDAGRELSAGVYICQFAAGDFVQLRKLVKLD